METTLVEFQGGFYIKFLNKNYRAKLQKKLAQNSYLFIYRDLGKIIHFIAEKSFANFSIFSSFIFGSGCPSEIFLTIFLIIKFILSK